MKHLSQKDLSIVYRKEIKKIGKEGFDDIKKNKSLRPKEENINNSIFLCHSHLDKTVVNKMLALFQGLNINLYIDWMDERLPSTTDRKTASMIKAKIDESHKFIFLATYNALRSKWCNWELGLAYSSKSETDIAILPIESKSGTWLGNEYLQLYPEMQIDYPDKNVPITEHNISINFYDTKALSFTNWLNARK